MSQESPEKITRNSPESPVEVLRKSLSFQKTLRECSKVLENTAGSAEQFSGKSPESPRTVLKSPQKVMEKFSVNPQKSSEIPIKSLKKIFRKSIESPTKLLRKSPESPQNALKKAPESPRKVLRKSQPQRRIGSLRHPSSASVANKQPPE